MGLDVVIASLGLGVKWVRGMPDWARLQHPLLIMKVSVCVVLAYLGLSTH